MGVPGVEPTGLTLGAMQAEWVKFRSLKSTWLLLAAAAIGLIGLSLVIAYITRNPSPGIDAEDVAASATWQGFHLGELLLGALGVLVVTAEYSRTIRTTLLAVPRPLPVPVLWAKLLVMIPIVALTLLVAALAAFWASQALPDQYRPASSLSDPGALRAVVGTALYLGGLSALGGAIGWILRSTPGALVTYLGLVLVLPGITGSLLGSFGRTVSKYLPTEAATSVVASIQLPDVLGPAPVRSSWSPGSWRPWQGRPSCCAAATPEAYPVSVTTSGGLRVRRLRRALGDLAIAVSLFSVATLIEILSPDQRGAEAIFWDLALAAPLVVRRAYPEVAAALVGLVALAQWFWGPPLMGDIAVLVVLYTLGTRATGPGFSRTRWSLGVAVLIAQLGVLMAVTRWQPAGGFLSPIMLTGTVTASWGAGLYVRTRRAWILSLRDRAETAERERDQQAKMAVAAERARIARELHDVVAHSLSVMITLNDAAAAVGAPGQVRDTVEQASEVGRQALSEMHALLGVLREDDGTDDVEYLPQPTTEQLAELAALVRSAGLEVELTTSGDLTALSPSVQLAAYRIIQESLTNVLKHGRNVEKVVVVVSRRADRLTISVTDDGQTSPPPDPLPGLSDDQGPRPGLGLVGMHERALIFGGTVQAGPCDPHGWRVATTLLLPGAARDPAQTTPTSPARVGT